jgi:hypothetical protein
MSFGCRFPSPLPVRFGYARAGGPSMRLPKVRITLCGMMGLIAAIATAIAYLAPIDEDRALAIARREVMRAYPANHLNGYRAYVLWRPEQTRAGDWEIMVDRPGLGTSDCIVTLTRQGYCKAVRKAMVHLM